MKADKLWWEQTADHEKTRILYIGDYFYENVCWWAQKISEDEILIDRFGTSRAVDDPLFQDCLRLYCAQEKKRDRILFQNGLRGWHLSDTKEYGAYYEGIVQFLLREYSESPLLLVLTACVEGELNARIIARNNVVKEIAAKYDLSVIDLYSASEGCAHSLTEKGLDYTEEENRKLGAFLADKIMPVQMDILSKCAKGYTNTQCLDCGNGAQIQIIWETTAQCFQDISELLEAEKYCCYADHKEGTALFATYIKGDEVLNLSYTPFEMATKIVREHTCNLPPRADVLLSQANEVSKEIISTVTPLLTQVKLRYESNNCGMTYLIRLGDGQFIVIDGGLGEEGEAEHLLELLKEQNVSGGKPKIAAWIFTHAHNDHYLGFVELMRHFSEEIIVKTLIYNWPLKQKSKGFSDLAPFEEVVAGMKDTKIITARSGQQYFYSDCRIDMLFAPEDLYPAYIANLNDSSIVFRMVLNGHRIMFLADMQLQTAAYFEMKYAREVLQSEIVQVAHHGYGGASPVLYWLIDPQIVLWPCPSYVYPDITNWQSNLFLRDSKNIKRTYVSGVEEVTLEMRDLDKE